MTVDSCYGPLPLGNRQARHHRCRCQLPWSRRLQLPDSHPIHRHPSQNLMDPSDAPKSHSHHSDHPHHRPSQGSCRLRPSQCPTEWMSYPEGQLNMTAPWSRSKYHHHRRSQGSCRLRPSQCPMEWMCYPEDRSSKLAR